MSDLAAAALGALTAAALGGAAYCFGYYMPELLDVVNAWRGKRS